MTKRCSVCEVGWEEDEPCWFCGRDPDGKWPVMSPSSLPAELRNPNAVPGLTDCWVV